MCATLAMRTSNGTHYTAHKVVFHAFSHSTHYVTAPPPVNHVQMQTEDPNFNGSVHAVNTIQLNTNLIYSNRDNSILGLSLHVVSQSVL